MNKEDLKMINMPESKREDYSKYTAPELVYTLANVLWELDKRDSEIYKMQSNVDCELSDTYHKIEAEPEDLTNTEKTKRYDELKETLRSRRKIKNEMILLDWVKDRIDIKKYSGKMNRMFEVLIRKEKNKELYGVITNEYRKGEITRIKNKYLN